MPESSRPRRAARLDVVVDRLLVGGREQDAPGDGAGLVHRLADDVVVEHGLVERDRQRLVRPEADGVAELALVVDAVDVDRAHADAVGADAEPDAPARQLVLGEEAVERGASAATSRTSPPTTMPGSSGTRASCTSFARDRRC